MLVCSQTIPLKEREKKLGAFTLILSFVKDHEKLDIVFLSFQTNCPLIFTTRENNFII
jgi:hypothetical protein